MVSVSINLEHYAKTYRCMQLGYHYGTRHHQRPKQPLTISIIKLLPYVF